MGLVFILNDRCILFVSFHFILFIRSYLFFPFWFVLFPYKHSFFPSNVLSIHMDSIYCRLVFRLHSSICYTHTHTKKSAAHKEYSIDFMFIICLWIHPNALAGRMYLLFVVIVVVVCHQDHRGYVGVRISSSKNKGEKPTTTTKILTTATKAMRMSTKRRVEKRTEKKRVAKEDDAYLETQMLTLNAWNASTLHLKHSLCRHLQHSISYVYICEMAHLNRSHVCLSLIVNKSVWVCVLYMFYAWTDERKKTHTFGFYSIDVYTFFCVFTIHRNCLCTPLKKKKEWKKRLYIHR